MNISSTDFEIITLKKSGMPIFYIADLYNISEEDVVDILRKEND